MEKDATIGTLKHEVLYQVARSAFNGTLDEDEIKIPYEIIPGQTPTFRCCVYKEREIIRQRICLAKNVNPISGEPCRNTVQIIPAACEGCPITRFVVTDNCQKCLAKKCQQACKFQAITMLRDKAYIDPDKCRECGQCHAACPYNAIADLMRPCKRTCPVDAIQMDENKKVTIDDEKCIRCGSCIKDCPFGAITDSSRMLEVIEHLKGDKPVYAMIAPAGEGQFGSNVTMESLRAGTKELGFEDMIEVSIGADFVSDSEAREWMEAYKEGKKMTTSCCPAFVHMIERHFPELADNISTTISPMAATARMIKAEHPDAVCIFIGPCIAKKSEAGQWQDVPGANADLVLTFEELDAMFRAKGVDLMSFGGNVQQGSIYGKRFANAGGVTQAVIQALKEQNESTDITVKECSGAAECKKALMMMKAGKLPEDFMEGMACVGGCVNGPGSIKPEVLAKRDREKLLAQADKRTITESMKPYKDLGFNMHRFKREEQEVKDESGNI